MRLYQLEYLMSVCRCGSISKAADELLVSRPAVSRALKELEEEFGVELFMRTTVGISLTEVGHIFYGKCAQIQQLLSELENEMNAIKKLNKLNSDRKLRIGLSPTASITIFPEYYPVFTKRYPDIVLELHELLADQSELLLEQNNLDVSLSVCFGESSDVLRFLNLTETELVFSCNKSHRLAGNKTLKIEDIYDEPIILLDKALMRGGVINDLYSKYGYTPNIKFRTSQISMLYQMIENGICSTIQFKGVIKDNENIISIPFEEKTIYPIKLTWNPHIPHNSAFHDLMNFINEQMKTKLDKKNAPSV